MGPFESRVENLVSSPLYESKLALTSFQLTRAVSVDIDQRTCESSPHWSGSA